MIEYRHYADAYYANQRDPTGATGSEMRALAMQIELALADEEING